MGRLLRSDFQRASKKFVDDLTNYSWSLDESPFRELDNGKFFRDAKQRLLDSVKGAIQKRFNETWAIGSGKSQIARAASLHDFRRSAAHEMWRAGSIIEESMEVTGHATQAMFKRDADLFSEDERRAK